MLGGKAAAFAPARAAGAGWVAAAAMSAEWRSTTKSASVSAPTKCMMPVFCGGLLVKNDSSPCNALRDDPLLQHPAPPAAATIRINTLGHASSRLGFLELVPIAVLLCVVKPGSVPEINVGIQIVVARAATRRLIRRSRASRSAPRRAEKGSALVDTPAAPQGRSTMRTGPAA